MAIWLDKLNFPTRYWLIAGMLSYALAAMVLMWPKLYPRIRAAWNGFWLKSLQVSLDLPLTDSSAEAYERGLKDGRLQQQRSDDSRQVEARARALEALGHIAEAVAKVTEPRTF